LLKIPASQGDYRYHCNRMGGPALEFQMLHTSLKHSKTMIDYNKNLIEKHIHLVLEVHDQGLCYWCKSSGKSIWIKVFPKHKANNDTRFRLGRLKSVSRVDACLPGNVVFRVNYYVQR